MNSGWKDWQIGEVVEAGEFQSYVQDQVVQYYENSAARGSAIATPSPGMMSYLQSTQAVEVYNGTSWGAVGQQSPNYIINGAFDIWQRGTSFTTPTSYVADRWRTAFSAGTPTISLTQQSLTPSDINAIGFGEGQFYLRRTITSISGGTNPRIEQFVEDVRTLAGQTVTVSFWAKADSSSAQNVQLVQSFGSGGSTTVTVESPFTVGTSWARHSVTFTLPSISGKTIGAGSLLGVRIYQRAADGSVLDVWGVQLEAGFVATPFRRNAPSLQAELAACQRYYEIVGRGASGTFISVGAATVGGTYQVQKRVAPTGSTVGTMSLLEANVGNKTATAGSIFISSSLKGYTADFTGMSGATQYRAAFLLTDCIALEAEL